MDDLRQLLSYQFMVSAFRAGTIVAVTAGVMGWFMVLRRQTFVGHTLAVVGFPGAAGATLLGLPTALGYFGFCIGASLVVAALPSGGRSSGYSEESAVIGSVQAMLLASGFFFVSLYAGNLNGLTALLFGSFLGITGGQVVLLLGVAVIALVALAVVARPLLFASLDQDVAAATGVPVRGVSVLFLVLLAVAVAEASQITGSLLVFALLVVPPAAAQTLTVRPALSITLAVTLGVLVTWLGLALAYYYPYPTGAFITSLSFVVYALARVIRALLDRRERSYTLQLETGAA